MITLYNTDTGEMKQVASNGNLITDAVEAGNMAAVTSNAVSVSLGKLIDDTKISLQSAWSSEYIDKLFSSKNNAELTNAWLVDTQNPYGKENRPQIVTGSAKYAPVNLDKGVRYVTFIENDFIRVEIRGRSNRGKLNSVWVSTYYNKTWSDWSEDGVITVDYNAGGGSVIYDLIPLEDIKQILKNYTKRIYNGFGVIRILGSYGSSGSWIYDNAEDYAMFEELSWYSPERRRLRYSNGTWEQL